MLWRTGHNNEEGGRLDRMTAGDTIALSFVIEPQQEADLPAVESLLDAAFGPDRHEKTAYRLRDGVEPVDALSLVARQNGRILGTIRFWPVNISGEGRPPVAALMLGPIAVEPALKGKGIGIALMREGLARAKEQGHEIIILVGDYSYYSRVGFQHTEPGQLIMPGWVDPARLLALELEPGALQGVSGHITSVRQG